MVATVQEDISLDSDFIKQYEEIYLKNIDILEDEHEIIFAEDTSAKFIAEPHGLICPTMSDKRIFNDYIINSLGKILNKERFYKKNKQLYSLKTFKIYEEIPEEIYKRAFTCRVQVIPNQEQINDYIEKQNIIYEEKLKQFKNNRGRNGDPDQPAKPRITKRELNNILSQKKDVSYSHFSSSDFNKERFFNHLISSDSLPKFEFFNETLKIPTLLEPSEKGRDLYKRWHNHMKKNHTSQLFWFQRLCFHYLFANTKVELPKIFVGIGPNKSGKGTFISLLESMAWCSPVKRFNQTNAEREYTTAKVFDGNETIKVCDEWLLTRKTDPQTQSLFKSATRRESIVIRDVGQEAKYICPSSSYVLFCNTNKDSEEQVLDESYRYFSAWRAYDRFDFCYVNWTNDYEDINEMVKYINSKSIEYIDFGKCLFADIIKIKKALMNGDFEMEYNEIPSSYKINLSGVDESEESKIFYKIFAAILNTMFTNHSSLGEFYFLKDELDSRRNCGLPITNELSESINAKIQEIDNNFVNVVKNNFKTMFKNITIPEDFFIFEINTTSSSIDYNFYILSSFVSILLENNYWDLPIFWKEYVIKNVTTKKQPHKKYVKLEIIKFKKERGMPS